MLKSIKREFLLNRNSLWQSLAVLGGAWLLGEALSLCIMYFAHEEEYFFPWHCICSDHAGEFALFLRCIISPAATSRR